MYPNNNIFSTELVFGIAVLGGVLAILLAVFYVLKNKRASPLHTELFVRTRSWAYIALGLSVVIFAPTGISTVLIAYLSFLALREMVSIANFRAADRAALLTAYVTIPVQYYLAYSQQLELFYTFIPIGMFVLTPFLLIGSGKTEKIGRSMALIPALLMLTVFMLSHIALLFNVDFQDFNLSNRALILYLVVITAFNDVFQFAWGKWLGKRKIVPSISPNKTWAGFIGGVLTTGVLSYFLHFLTPFSGIEAFFAGLILGGAGFAGDILISAIKRDLRLKDTSDFIPGHGGIMDRLDSLLLTAPTLYLLLVLLAKQTVNV